MTSTNVVQDGRDGSRDTRPTRPHSLAQVDGEVAWDRDAEAIASAPSRTMFVLCQVRIIRRRSCSLSGSAEVSKRRFTDRMRYALKAAAAVVLPAATTSRRRSSPDRQLRTKATPVAPITKGPIGA